MSDGNDGFFAAVENALSASHASEKLSLVSSLSLATTETVKHAEVEVMKGNLRPGRPEKPELVHPSKVTRRRLHSPNGRVALVHAVAHIEFNAINLALDAVWRFRGMPAAYYIDWLQVAKDEARHFGWLQRRLSDMGSAYGAFPAHDGLWEAAVKTAHDPLPRMALVPRVLEARGLDVTPGLIRRLIAAGDPESAAILGKILAEEVAHVEAGTRWYHYLCQLRDLDPDKLFPELLKEYSHGTPKGPFNFPARQAAGFTQSELDWLCSIEAA